MSLINHFVISKIIPEGIHFKLSDGKKPFTGTTVKILLKLMALNFNYRPSINRYLKTRDGWLNFSIGFKTEDDRIAQSIIFQDGRVTVKDHIPHPIDACMIFIDEATIWEMISQPPSEVLNLLLKSKIRTQGNMNYLSLFNFFLSLLLFKKNKKMLARKIQQDIQARHTTPFTPSAAEKARYHRQIDYLRSKTTDNAVCLPDPFLGDFTIDDFPRLNEFLHIHRNHRPAVCIERPLLITQWHRNNGFERQPDGTPWNPVLRQGQVIKYLLENKAPRIRANDLLAGTTTTKEIGVVLYPDAHAALLWGELKTLGDRALNPYSITDEEIERLHFDILPYWNRRTFREYVRENHQAPLSQQLDERFAVYFQWKTVAISHTVANFPKLLKLGTNGLIAEIKEAIQMDKQRQKGRIDLLKAMISALEGMQSYARNLGNQARAEALTCADETRRAELLYIDTLCAKVPSGPAQTLDEALQCLWIAWIALHMENTNAGLSLGRLDQWLQPYFAADFKQRRTAQEKTEYIRHAIEIVGCFYLRATDHLPMIPDIGNYLFGGSSSDQAITLGGLTTDGQNGVNDMTYILLKVTELLKLRDPNVNARYYHGINSENYLRRLCEVNLITAATPSIHGDETVLKAIEGLAYAPEDARDWSATGCVEPTISGKHFGHTGCIMFNMVAALEMALNQGRHPLMNWHVGPATDPVERFESFEAFWSAYTRQIHFLIDNVVEYNNLLGHAHTIIRPTPLLSSLIEGCAEKGRDVTQGGARYNSTGTACIGLADIVDSMMAIRQLVFEERRITFPELKQAIDHNFEGYAEMHALIRNRVPKFGSGNAQALELANRLTQQVHDYFSSKRNYRGGPYTTGFWSMSNHVAFGTLTGALPSGRLAGKAFTPGLTPSAAASGNLLDNLRDVARLKPGNINNNMAFNVKYVPSAQDSHAQAVDQMAAYARTYFALGGMQMQLNVVSGAILKDAMRHPENYRDLLVRISGYNAYFVTLNRDMQIELIERAEYG